MSFNNPEELIEIRDYYKNGVQTRPVEPTQINRVEDWLQLMEKPTPAFRRHLNLLYGDDEDFLAERRDSIADVLRLFANRYGPHRRAVVARSPGRINLMGRHIDHRGGTVNVMSINKEVTMAASLRDDDVIRVVNTDASFRPFEFSLSEHFTDVTWDSWVGYLSSERVNRIVSQQRGSWANYVKAAALRLQYMLPDIKLKGMDVAIAGDIPIAAGLSSSSAVVVAATEAMITLNELDVTPERFVDLCGEGEWFVGSRGGSADHAAMKFARRGQVISMSFYPFDVVGRHRFPEHCRLIIANSGIKAEKSDEARNHFNHRVACYELGMLLLKHSYRIEHLRDLNPAGLELPLDAIYRGLLKVPEVLHRDEIRNYFPPSDRDAVQRILETHSGVEEYPLRSVILYGISECARGQLCGELLERGDAEALGRYMVISHDGDRVSRRDSGGGGYVDNDFRADDRYLAALIERAGDEEARLGMQHGGYFCSTPEIDFIVDTACAVEGVHGAQLSGAGLGGCAMILADADAVDAVVERLRERYYRPSDLEPDITVCSPVQGSGVLKTE